MGVSLCKWSDAMAMHVRIECLSNEVSKRHRKVKGNKRTDRFGKMNYGTEEGCTHARTHTTHRLARMEHCMHACCLQLVLVGSSEL